jgi:hypothetical protein
MDVLFAWCEQLVKDHSLLFIMFASVLGSFWGVWPSVVKEVERSSRQQPGYPDIQLVLTRDVFLEIKWFFFSLLLSNTIFAFFFFAVVALLFYLLNQFYEAIWVKIIVALSVSRAIAKKQGKISLLNSYLGGFDLDSVPLIGQFAEGLTESYENWHQRKFKQLDDRCNKILSELCVERLRQERQGAIKRQQQSEYLFRNQAIQMVENQVEQRINHLPNETRKSRYLEQLQQIKNLPEQDKRIYLIALVEELCPEMIDSVEIQQ